MSDKVTPFPVKVRDNSKQLTLANPYAGCQHKRAIVDQKLLELECADCHAKLNPIQFLVTLATTEAAFEWKQEALRQERKKIEERKRCRCTKCGEWTEVRPVGQREVARIKRARMGERSEPTVEGALSELRQRLGVETGTARLMSQPDAAGYVTFKTRKARCPHGVSELNHCNTCD